MCLSGLKYLYELEEMHNDGQVLAFVNASDALFEII